MNSYEKDEIRNLPDKYKPIGAWGYFFYQILFAIPVVGLICLIIFACSSSNINRRNFARSYFCALILMVILGIVFYVLGFGGIILDYITQFMQGGGQ